MGRIEQITKERLRKLRELREKGINPYPYSFNKKDNDDLQEKYSRIRKGQKTKDSVKVAGRIMSMRDLGKISFVSLQDGSGKIQAVFQEKETPEKIGEFLRKYIDVGDFVGIEGIIFRTKRGELSVLVKKLKLLSKSILPLPEKWHGLQDKEDRYRKRYLDLIMNPEVKEIFVKRQEIIDSIREFMIKRDYTEVQTPVLQPIYGGGNAKPFISKLNALDMTVYMRIANEMYLKRLIGGGFEKIFEFSIDFRNEGIDKSHNPEFLLFEAMTAFDDYKDGMKLIEDITEHVVKKVNGSTKVKYQGEVLDFKAPWKKISVKEAIKKYVKIDIEKTSDAKLKSVINKHQLKLKGEFNRGNAIMAILEEFCEKNFVQPTILYDYPVETSKLAKVKRNDPRYAERFEQYVNGFELGNNYSELNDPEILEKNWKEEEEALKKGDDEAQRMDHDFINMLKVGMPPTCGIAIGVDRLVMVLTNQPSIRDVILFPFMRQQKKEKEE